MIFAIKAIKYAFVNKIWFSLFQSSWNLSRLPFVFWQYRSEVTVQRWGFVFILAGFQSLLYFCTPLSIILYPLFCRLSFISRALLFSHSLAVSNSPPLASWLLLLLFFPTLLQFHLVLYSYSITGLRAHKQLTLPTLMAPTTFNHLPQMHHLDLNALWLLSPVLFFSCHPSSFSLSSPFPPFLLPALPHRAGDRSFVLDICFVWWLIEMSMWGEGP